MESKRYKIVSGYGSPEVSDLKPGETITFSTEFPSLKNEKGKNHARRLPVVRLTTSLRRDTIWRDLIPS